MTKEERQEYDNARYKSQQFSTEKTRKFVDGTIEGMYFKGSKNDEPAKCNFFGCGRSLSLHEGLCGNRCVKHSKM